MPYIGNQPGTGVRSRFIYTATASQTTFTGADNNSKTLKYSDADYIDVYLNGVCLVPVTDYAASTKTSVVLTQAASLNDTLEVVAYDIATISDTVSKADGGTFDGNITITTNDNSNQLILKSTDDDASIGPVLEFNRSSSSPSVDDQLGRIDIVGKNDADQDVDYVRYISQIRDETDGTEDGRMAINTIVNGSMISRMNVEPTETVFNDESNDVDFRVESNNNANMLLVDGENDRVKVSGTGGTALFNVHEAVTATDPQFVSIVNETDGQDTRVLIGTQANDGGDPYVKFDGGGSNMIVGLHWEGTTNNKLMLGAADRPSDTIKGIRLNGDGNVAMSATDFFGTLASSDDGKLGHIFYVSGRHYMQVSANSTGAETIIINNTAGAGNSAGVIQYRTRTIVEGSLNGTSSGLAISNVSDYRKKENVANATGCLDKINGLRPVTYTHRSEYDSDTTTVHTGFIAHEVSDHLPSIVNGTKDALETWQEGEELPDDVSVGGNKLDGEGNTIAKMQSLSYSDHEMIANLVGAIKELKAENDAMRTRLDALEAG